MGSERPVPAGVECHIAIESAAKIIVNSGHECPEANRVRGASGELVEDLFVRLNHAPLEHENIYAGRVAHARAGVVETRCCALSDPRGHE